MSLKDNFESVVERIHTAAVQCGRDPDEIQLVAVSKTIPAARVEKAIAAGVQFLGENYVQEARDKFDTLSAHPVSWHFIGHLQSNKAKYAVRIFNLIHSVDSLKLAKELNKQAAKNGKVQNILVQVNIAEEATKSGASVAQTRELVSGIGKLENLSLKGLMTMPPYFYEPEKARPFFKALRELRDRIQAENIPNISLKELSMGMTGDFEVAIAEGATLVRIGTAIFGDRY